MISFVDFAAAVDYFLDPSRCIRLQQRVRTEQARVTLCPLRSAPAVEKGAHSPLSSSTTLPNGYFGQVLKDYSGVQVGTNVNAPDLTYAGDMNR